MAASEMIRTSCVEIRYGRAARFRKRGGCTVRGAPTRAGAREPSRRNISKQLGGKPIHRHAAEQQTEAGPDHTQENCAITEAFARPPGATTL